MLTLKTQPIANPKVISRITGEEAVLVLPTKGEIKVLNKVGSHIWSLVDGTRTVNDIATMVCREYEVALDEAQNDVLTFLTDLLDRDVISLPE